MLRNRASSLTRFQCIRFAGPVAFGSYKAGLDVRGECPGKLAEAPAVTRNASRSSSIALESVCSGNQLPKHSFVALVDVLKTLYLRLEVLFVRLPLLTIVYRAEARKLAPLKQLQIHAASQNQSGEPSLPL